MPGPAPLLSSEAKGYVKMNMPGFGERWQNSTLEELRSPAHGPVSEVSNARRSSSPASHAVHMLGAQAGGIRVPAPRVR